MKKIQYTILYTVALLTIVSCGKDFLTKSPTTAIRSDQAIQTKNDVKYAVNGAYSLMKYLGYYGAAMFYYGDVKGDDMQSRAQNSTNIYYCYMFEHIPSALRVSALWGRPWYVIRQTSNVIEAIENGKIMDASKEELQDYIGQAMTIRALAHFDLVRCFGYPYAKDNGASLGVPIVDHVMSFEEMPERNTVKECYEFIVSELKKAIPMLSTNVSDGKINAYGARALLSRVYLYSEQNDLAYSTAKELIEEIESNKKYYLASNATYLSYFSLENKFDSESLFEIVNSTTDNQSWDALSYQIHWWGYARAMLTASFAEFMKQDTDDVRYKLINQVKQNGVNKWWLSKYPGPSATTPSTENNYVILRLSEVYLIAAEAGVKSASVNKSEALEYLNAIVKRGNPNNIVTLQEFSLDRVLDERRKELVGEGHRFFDLLRNGKEINREGGYHLPNVPTNITWDYYKVVLPIPSSQMEINKNMEQNPEYSRT